MYVLHIESIDFLDNAKLFVKNFHDIQVLPIYLKIYYKIIFTKKNIIPEHQDQVPFFLNQIVYLHIVQC